MRSHVGPVVVALLLNKRVYSLIPWPRERPGGVETSLSSLVIAGWDKSQKHSPARPFATTSEMVLPTRTFEHLYWYSTVGYRFLISVQNVINLLKDERIDWIVIVSLVFWALGNEAQVLFRAHALSLAKGIKQGCRLVSRKFCRGELACFFCLDDDLWYVLLVLILLYEEVGRLKIWFAKYPMGKLV